MVQVSPVPVQPAMDEQTRIMEARLKDLQSDEDYFLNKHKETTFPSSSMTRRHLIFEMTNARSEDAAVKALPARAYRAPASAPGILQ